MINAYQDRYIKKNYYYSYLMIFKQKFYCFMRNNILLENVITGEKEEKEKPKADTKTRGKAIAMQI